jgi:L-aspartate oxidase
MIGGVSVDAQARTSLPRLWGAGEVTSSGLHGANRLASNSLLEGLVFGLRAGRLASQAASAEADQFTPFPIESTATTEPALTDESLRIDDVANSLSSEMWRDAGIARDRDGLTSALQQIEFWDRYVGPREFTGPKGWELQNLLLVARLVVKSALAREESRGVHYRTDFPETREDLATHVEVHPTHQTE